jgi:hypothetical protein
MVNYALTKFSTSVGDHDTVLAELETQLETVDNTKRIYLCEILKRGNDFVGVLLYLA